MRVKFFDRSPLDASEQCEPSEVIALLRAMDGYMTSVQLAHLDVCMLMWVFEVLRRKEDREGILEMQMMCEIATDLIAEEDQKMFFGVRWEAFSDLLEGLRLTLIEDDTGASSHVLALRKQVLRAVSANGGVKQSQLAATMKWSPGHATHMLRALESRRMIARKKKGDDYWVDLPK